MKISNELIDDLTNALYSVAIAAFDDVSPNGEIPFGEHRLALNYAMRMVAEVLSDWEERMGDEWEMEKGNKVHEDEEEEWEVEDDSGIEMGFDPFLGYYTEDC